MCSLKTMMNRAASLFLCVVLLAGNLFSCTKTEPQSVNVQGEFLQENSTGYLSSDAAFSMDGIHGYIFENYGTFDMETLLSQSDYFSEDIENYLFEEYGAFISEASVAFLQADDFQNTVLVLDDGRELNINKVLIDLAIGGGIIIITSAIISIPAGPAFPVVFVINCSREMAAAAAGMALDAAISGAIEYAESGNKKNAGYAAIEGAAEGVKYGAIIGGAVSVAGTVFKTIRVATKGGKGEKVLASFADDAGKSGLRKIPAVKQAAVSNIDDAGRVNSRSVARRTNAASNVDDATKIRLAAERTRIASRFSGIKVTGKIDDMLRASDHVDDAVGKIVPVRVSKPEYDLYAKIKLKSKIVNGRPALVRGDIDPNFVPNVVIGGKKNTMTNLELMRSGKAPFIKTATGTEQVTLHHVRQQSDGVLAEILNQSEEKASGLYNVLHDSNLPSQVDRKTFDAERMQYWANRAKDFVEAF